ncbi:competence type IV pilus ATPase ComGA [Alteribacillus iranensis]|uniref:Competence-related pilin export protein ComGA n=1 Tax=Alteribacillus iranensis TaxID=930128 RepID=A0A1I1ZEU3_9BACI|nr:competence type IV pilus ATPase ComGA [Alteribacillus iranensis]SFE30102.1 competence-related pilin export protein ComGA [Alteribacillus iranensis]
MRTTDWESRQLIDQALRLQATDIHFHPLETRTILFYRIHGRLHKMGVMNKRDSERLIAHFKFRSGMDIGEKRRPQNASVFEKRSFLPVNLRFSTMPSQLRESLSIRLLPQYEAFTLSRITFDTNLASFFRYLLTERQGLVILTGPTGSGKTSTLYTFMNEISYRNNRIVSIEDPIEIQNDQFIQTEINEKAGLSYTEMLRSSLRHDPDVLMIGEIRDEDTAQLAIRAALTGHLVLTTMHANSPFGAIRRLLDYNLSLLDLEETLLCISSQGLFPRYCPFCQRSGCSPYCQIYKRMSRIALFDILAKKELQEALSEHTSNDHPLTFSRQNQWWKGLALGLFSEEMRYAYG